MRTSEGVSLIDGVREGEEGREVPDARPNEEESKRGLSMPEELSALLKEGHERWRVRRARRVANPTE